MQSFLILQDDPDGPIEKDANDLIEETIEHQSDAVYDYQLDIDCHDMPITIDELSMGVNNVAELGIDTSKHSHYTPESSKLINFIFCL